ncbi:hypothetical protein DFJ77DRAFT_466205 [Powellomyces hirtus]|nr:hypothetical protein DFJ77DRAFT_466205 [Powellomyces hirtus]
MRAPEIPPPGTPPPDANGFYLLETIPIDMMNGRIYLPYRLSDQQWRLNMIGFILCLSAFLCALLFLRIERRVALTTSKMLALSIVYGDIISVSWALSRHTSALLVGHFAAGWFTCQVQGFIDGGWGIFAQSTFFLFTAERYISIVMRKDVTFRQIGFAIGVAAMMALGSGLLPFVLMQNAGVMPNGIWCTPPWTTGSWHGSLFSAMGVVAIGSVFIGIVWMYWQIYKAFTSSAKEARDALQSNLGFSTMPTAMSSDSANAKGCEEGFCEPCGSTNASPTLFSAATEHDSMEHEVDDSEEDINKEYGRRLDKLPALVIAPTNVADGPSISGAKNIQRTSPGSVISMAASDAVTSSRSPRKLLGPVTTLSRSFDRLRGLRGSVNDISAKLGAARRRKKRERDPNRKLALLLARRAFIIVASYYACLLPLFLCILYSLVTGHPVPIWADCISYFAAVIYTNLNPLLFLTMNSQFVQAAADEFQSWRDFSFRLFRR